ncbi:uncharacterized protein LOC121874883 [Homarus americanus]|uniref:Uncharacterized protein n=1 Tax=Homarus americanus TaxID=6706 RepID=A0A8J5MS82_HOMAM|nr:uncharacterized protein LOC121874883 [Homarus americanus]KAG7161587.1 hypothetical protein Hamer_G014148 [Homarus americanus]
MYASLSSSRRLSLTLISRYFSKNAGSVWQRDDGLQRQKWENVVAEWGEASELEFFVLTPQNLDEVMDFQARYFYPRNNLCLGLGMSLKTKMDEGHVRRSLASGMSVGVREKATQKQVAQSLASMITADYSFLYNATKYSTKLEKSYALIVNKVWRQLDVFQDAGVDQVQYLTRGCFQPDYPRRGVTLKMMQMNLELGSEQGCRIACGISSSLKAEKCFIKAGFDVRTNLDLRTLEDGLVDLSRMGHKHMKGFTKKLSPEAALKSKV